MSATEAAATLKRRDTSIAQRVEAMEALAGLSPEAFMEAHVEACCRPLRYLARSFSGTRS